MENFFRESGVKWLWEKIKTLLSAKQDKLVSGTNIKTINGNSLLGSGDISIEGGDSTGDVDEGRLVWSDDYAPAGTLLDNIMKISGNNVLAFMPPSAITIEYSTDNGVTWLDYEVSDANKTKFVTPELGAYRLRLGKDLGSVPLINDRLRITFDFIVGGIRFTPSKVMVKLESLGYKDAFHTRISTEMYANYNQDVWEDVADQRSTMPDWGTYKLTGGDWGFASPKYRARLRCEFYRTATSVNRTGITNMILMATKITNANSYAKNHHLYTFDFQQNATFPAYIKARKFIPNGGKSTQVLMGDGSLEEESALAVASAIDAVHAEEADYAGVADKADKLTTARKIGLTGGAVGTATAFDGSKDISIPVTKVNSNVVTWSRDAAMSTPPITVLAKMGNNNVLAFFKPSALSVEYSTDNGNSWLDYGLTDKEKTHLTTPMVGYHNIYLGKQSGNTNLSSDNRLRITFDFIEGEIRAAIKQLLIKFQNGASSTSYYYIKISYELYKNYKTDTWISTDDVRVTTNGYITFSTINFNSYDDPMFGYPYQSAIYPARMRVEFFRTVADTYNLNISNFIAITSDVPSAPNNMAKMSLPCSLDWQQNATFPANVKGKKLVTDGGTSEQILLGDGTLITFDELKAKLGLI